MSATDRRVASRSARLVGRLLPVLLGTWVRAAAAGCENCIEVRGPGFAYSYCDIEPYADKPIGTDAVSDSLYYRGVARLYERLAGALAVGTYVHRTMQAEGASAKPVPSGEILRLWQGASFDLRRAPPSAGGAPVARPDTLVDRLRRGATDSTAVLYAVQIGSFVEKRNALARGDVVSSLIRPLHSPLDSTRVVDWRNSACGDGDRRTDLFLLGPDAASGPGYRVLHGLFIDRRDALAALANVRARFGLPAAIVPVRVTGRVLRAAVRPSFRREK